MVSLNTGVMIAVLGMVLFATGCGSGGAPGGIGRSNRYDYSPSVMQTGDVRQYWWCGEAVNPNYTKQDTDAILYESVNMKTKETVGPVTVLAETPGTWDSMFLCNPKVVGGVFENPLGDGKTYQYALYYVATNDDATNNIGVAFSNDGVAWKKYPDPVLLSGPTTFYGIGQPSPYNTNGKAAILMFYEDWTPSVHHVAATSTDGLHFTVQGTVTIAGLDPDSAVDGWGDIAFDPTSGYWYAVFSRKIRDQSTTGGVLERGSMGVELYRVPADSILTGATPWEELHTFDTNLTGYETNFLPSFVRDSSGNINIGAYPTVEMYVSISYPRPAWNASPKQAGMADDPHNWDIVPMMWVPNQPMMAFNRYSNGKYHEVTTGWVDSSFKLQGTLGHLYEAPQQGATVAFYGCKNGSTDYFVSLDNECEGQRILGKNGYAYANPVAGMNLVPLYRCITNRDHFVSSDPKCEGQTTDKLLGYVLP